MTGCRTWAALAAVYLLITPLLADEPKAKEAPKPATPEIVLKLHSPLPQVVRRRSECGRGRESHDQDGRGDQ